ncbi:HutD family protein [Pedococcus bigeumensis]|nr:HutD family protein [Pedococcus bigeumensis]
MFLADLPRSRWKNGQGERATIVEGDGWSLSHAWIEADVPFSDFPAMDRTCVLLAGGGLSLLFDGRPGVDLPTPGTAQSFPGQWRARARLSDGPCHVVNVMTSRTRFTHTVEISRQLTGSGYAVVLAGSIDCDGIVARFGDTVTSPCDGVGSSDLLVIGVMLQPVSGSTVREQPT